MKKKLFVLTTVLLVIVASISLFACEEEQAGTTAQHTITFNENYTGAPIAQVKVIDGYYVQQKEPKAREGYAFKGWYTDKDGKNEFKFENGKSVDNVTTDITLYAKWEVKVILASISATYIGDEIIIGDTLSKNDIKVVARFSDNTQKIVTDYVLGEWDTSTAGEKSISISYTHEDDTANCVLKITVIPPAVTLVGIEYTGDSIHKVSMFDWNAFNISLSNGIVAPISDFDVLFDSETDLTTYGEKEFTLVYGENSYDVVIKLTKDLFVELGEVEVPVEYAGDTYYFTFELVAAPIVLVGIEVAYNGGDIVVNEDINREDITVIGYFDNDTSGEITDYIIRDYDKTTVGIKTIEIKYKEEVEEITVRYIPKALDRISTEYVGGRVVVGRTLSLSDFIVTAIYNNEDTRIIDPVIGNYDFSTIGNKTVTLSYTEDGIEKTDDVEFTVYLEEDGYYILGIDNNWGDSTYKMVPNPENSVEMMRTNVLVDGINDEFKIIRQHEGAFTYFSNVKGDVNTSIYSQETPDSNIALVAGQYDVYLNTATTYIYFEETDKELYSIEASYVGEDIVVGGVLDRNDIVLTATYKKEHREDIIQTETDYEVSGFESATAGDKTVTITFGGLTDEIVVTVIEKEVVKITAEYKNNVVYVNEKLTSDDFIVTAHYNNDTTDIVTGTVLEYDYQSVGEKTVTVSYTENNITKTFDFEFTLVFKNDGYYVLGIDNNWGDNTYKMIINPENDTEMMITNVIVDGINDEVKIVRQLNGEIEYYSAVKGDVDTSIYTQAIIGGNIALKAGEYDIYFDTTSQFIYMCETEMTLVSIEATYNGEEIVEGGILDKNDITVVATYTKEYRDDILITLENGDYEISGFDTNNVANQTVMITFSGKTDTISVPVIAKIVVSITAEYKEEVAYVNDILTSDDFKVIATYNNDTTAEVSGTVGAYDYNSIGEKTITISYTENEITKSFDVELTLQFENDGYYVLGIDGNWGVDTYKLTENTENSEEMMIKGIVVDGENDTIKIVSQIDGVLTYYNEVKQGVKAQYAINEEENIAFVNGTYDLYFDLLRKALWVDVTLASIEVEFIGTPITENTVSLTNEMLKVTAHYSDGTKETVTGFEIGEHNFTTFGQKTVTVTYNGKSDDLEIVILRKALVSIDAELKSERTILVGEDLVSEDFTVVASYNNGTTAEVAGVVGAFNKTSIGEKTVEISYEENSITETDTVTYTAYFENDGYYVLGIDGNWGVDTYKLTENTENSEEMMIKGIVVDGENDTIKIVSQIDGELTYYNQVKQGVKAQYAINEEENIAFVNGTYDLYFDLLRKALWVDVTLSSIEVEFIGNPITENTVSLSPEMLKVTAHYSDGTKETVTGFEIGEHDFTTFGQKTVTVTYNEKSDDLEIVILRKALVSIDAELKSERTILVGEDLVSEDFTVVASYNNGTTAEVTGVVGAFNKTSIGEKTVEISYEENGITETDTVTYTAYFANDGYYVLGIDGNWGVDTYKLTENTENSEEMMIKGIVVDGENDTIKIVSQIDGELTYYNQVKQGVKAQYAINEEENIAFVNGTYDLYFDLLRKALWVDVTLASIEVEFIGTPITENTVSLTNEMLKVTANYSDGSKETVNGFEIGEHDFTTFGQKTVTITYNEKRDDLEIVILRKALVSIDAELKSQRTILVGEDLVSEDFTVVASYNNGTTAEVTGVVGAFNKTSIGEKTVEISYEENGITETDTVTYTAYFENDGYYLLGINGNWGIEEYTMINNSENTAEMIALGVTSDEVNDEFKIIYQNDGTITYYSSVKSNVNQNFYDQTSADGNITLKQGNYDIYFDTTSKFIYIGYALETITATYHGYNGVVYQNENLNLAEITVEGTYYDTSTKAITAYSVGDLDSSEIGIKHVEITYRNKTALMEVEIKVAPKRTIHYYNVNGWNGVKAYAWSGTGEDKVEYFGAGKEMTFVGDDWFSIEVDERATGITFINAEDESFKTEELTIDVDKVYYNYQEEWVADKPTLDRIEATYSGDKVTVGLALDESKISATAHYSDGMTKGIDVFTVSGFNKDTIAVQDVTVTYEYFNGTVYTEYTDTIEVEVIDKVLLSIEAQLVKQDKIVVGYELKATDFKVLAYFNNSDTPVDVTNESTVAITCDTSSIDSKVATVSYTYPSVTVLELVTKSYDVNVTVYFENDGYYIIGMDGNNGSDEYEMVENTENTETTEYMYKVLDINSDNDKIKIVYQNGNTLKYFNTLKDGVTTKTGATVNDDGYIELNNDQYDLYLDTVSDGIWIEYSLDSITAVYSGVVYQNEELVVDNIVVTAIYNDTLQVVLSEGDYEIGTFSSATLGTTTVVISYNGKTADMNVNIEVAPTRTLYYYNENNWNTVYAYAWSGTSGNNIKYLGTWPGTEMTEDVGNNGWFSIVVDERATTIIFNDGSGNQTADLEIDATKIYYREKNWNATRLTEIVASYQGSDIVVGMDLNKSNIIVTAINSDGTNARLSVSDFEISGFSSAEAGVKTVTVTYDNETTTVTVTVIPVALSSISAMLNDGKTVYAGDTLEASDFTVTATYNNGAQSLVNENITVTCDTQNAGNVQATIEYTENSVVKTCTVNITVVEVVITGITATRNNQNTIYAGDTLNASDFTVKEVYNNGTEIIVTENITVSHETLIAGINNVTVTLTKDGKPYTTTATVTAVAVEISGISATYNGGTVYAGGTLSKENFTVKELYNNGSEIEVAGTENIEINYETLVAGINNVTVTLTKDGQPYTTTATVTALAVEVTSISATLKNGSALVDEVFNEDDFTVTATYNSGAMGEVTGFTIGEYDNTSVKMNKTVVISYEGFTSEVTYDVLFEEDGYYVLGIDGDWGTTSYKMSENTEDSNEMMITNVTVDGVKDAIKVVKQEDGTLSYCGTVEQGNESMYDGYEASTGNIVLKALTYDIYYKISEDKIYLKETEIIITLTEITAELKDGITVYVGDTLDKDDFTVTASYDNGSSQVVTNNITVTCNTTVAGTVQATIEYTENSVVKTCTVDIMVVEVKLSSITATLNDEVTVYAGDTLTADKFTVTATYNNGNETNVTEDITVTHEALVAGTAQITVKYTEDEIEQSTTVDVTVVAVEQTDIIATLNDGVTVYAGDTLTADKFTVKEIYNNGNEITVEGIQNVTVTHETLVVGYNQVTVTYTKDEKDYTDEVTITANEVVLDSITASLKVGETIYTGDTLTSDMFTVNAIYNNGTQTEVTEDITVDCDTSDAGTNVMATVTYNTEKSTTVTVTVIQLEVTAIQASLKDTNVRPKDEFTKESFTVIATYNKGTTGEITDYTIGDYDNSSVGTDKTVTITYKECTSTITYDVLFAEDGYYILGVNGDWGTAAYKMSANPENQTEMMYAGLELGGNDDAIKVVKQESGEISYFGNIKDEVPTHIYSYDGSENIALSDGTYDFYFDTTKENVEGGDKALYIGGTIKVSFKKPDNYGTTVNVYAWSETEDTTQIYSETWPGTAMTDDGDGWYSAEISTYATKIIFNDGSNQTSNLDIDINKGYYYNVSE